MNRYKSFRFWFTFFSIVVCAFNFFDLDDKNILLFVTSPPVWLIENSHFFNQVGNIPIMVIDIFTYTITIFFWFMLGFLLDKAIKVLRSRK